MNYSCNEWNQKSAWWHINILKCIGFFSLFSPKLNYFPHGHVIKRGSGILLGILVIH